ncbi:MAG: imidazoleglycerol-phosphate dehydratase [Candidatus Omnitrophica bacterium]|nr:imidazoleglycerol-phosphate dehydratase [Candidatus Omnitrophota bacterium]
MKKKERKAEVKRKTKETEIKVSVNVDGKGKNKISTGIDFLNHMLDLFAYHGLFDLAIKAKGDLNIDIHHTNEDIALCLGQVFKKALGACRGIRRFGSSEVPMDHARAKVTIDIANRFSYTGIKFKDVSVQPVLSSIRSNKQGENYSMEDGNDFLDSFAKNLGMNLHVDIVSRSDMHHMLEAVFKALGIAMDRATEIDPRRRKEIPSTKGVL